VCVTELLSISDYWSMQNNYIQTRQEVNFLNLGIITREDGHPNECVQVHRSDLTIVKASIK